MTFDWFKIGIMFNTIFKFLGSISGESDNQKTWFAAGLLDQFSASVQQRLGFAATCGS